MKRINRLNYIIAVILVLFVLACISVTDGVGSKAYAASAAYSNVLGDLRKDSTFNIADYPANANDVSIQVIQIAESVDGELLIYTYQPCRTTHKIYATSINMSLTDTAENYTLYNLSFLSSEHTLCKYKVFGFKVSSDNVRYYNIASIYRPFIEGVDEQAGNDNTISDIACQVAQKWTANTGNGKTVYTMTEAEVVRITDKRCGFIRYVEGLTYATSIGACDGHFVAFSCNYDIDRLLTARVSFVEQTYKKTLTGTTEGKPTPNETYILHDEYATTKPVLMPTGKRQKWKRIQTGEEFAKNNAELSDNDKTNLASYQYVLNFYETTYEAAQGSLAWISTSLLSPIFAIPAFQALKNASGTVVTDVSILELTFEKDGQVFNLGVVDNKQSGPRDPINQLHNGLPVWAIIAIVVVSVVVVCALGIVLSIVFPPLGKALLWLLKGLLWLITSPFRLIALIVRNISERKKSTPTKTLPKSRKTKAPQRPRTAKKTKRARSKK